MSLKCYKCNIKFEDEKSFKKHLNKNPKCLRVEITRLAKETIIKKTQKIELHNSIKEIKARDGVDKTFQYVKLLEYKKSAKRFADSANYFAEKEANKQLLESEVEAFRKSMQREPKRGSIIKAKK